MSRSRLLRGALTVLLAASTACASRCAGRTEVPSPPTSEPTPAVKAAPAGVTRHVLAVKAYVYREPHRQSPPFVSLRLPAPVVVDADTVAGKDGLSFRRIQGGPGDGGFIAEEDLGDAPPTAPQCLDKAQLLLGEGKLDEAVLWAERSVALEASSREAWDLLAAIHDARGDVVQARPVYAQRAQLGALPSPAEELPRWPLPSVGEQRYIAATKLRVRDGASRTAKVVSELPLNAPVEVVGLEGEFAKVAWTSRPRDVWVVILQRSTGQSTEEAAERREGYMGAAYLSPTPSTREELLARADEADAQGHVVQVARALERASLLAPRDGGLLERLTRAAARAKLYPLAATAALKADTLRSLSEGQRAGEPVELEMYFGCTREPPVEPANACIPRFDSLGQCPPCGSIGSDFYATGDETQEELEAMRRSDEAERKDHQDALAAHEKAQAALAKQTARLRKQYPSGPWVHARIQGARQLHEEGHKVFVYALSFSLSHSCDTYDSQTDYEALQFPAQPRPWPDEGDSLEVWATSGLYEDALYGVVAARSEQEARTLILSDSREERRHHFSTPEDMAPKPFTTGPWQNCGCCGC